MAMSTKAKEYFSSMNSLSARIASDIKYIEDNKLVLDESITGSKDEETIFNAKCAAIDKYLIEDVLHKVQPLTTTKSTAPFKYPKFKFPLVSNYLNALILNVYPSKPEKYVFEESGGVWLDEHSAPFSFCKTSQVKYCPLGKTLIQQAAAAHDSGTEELIVPPKKRQAALKNGPIKIPDGNKMHNNKGKDLSSPDYNDGEYNGLTPKSSINDDIVDVEASLVKKSIKSNLKASSSGGHSFFGINVMDFMGGQAKPMKIKTKEKSIDRGNKGFESVDLDNEETIAETEDKLPQQKQNLQLIAELQAKLKKNNPSPVSSVDETREKKVLEHSGETGTAKNYENNLEKEAKRKSSSKKSAKVKKPKAPPPPPPPPMQPKEIESKPTTPKHPPPPSTKPPPIPVNLQHKQQIAITEQLKSAIAGKKKSKIAVEVAVQSTSNLQSAQKPDKPPPPNAVETAAAEFCVDISSPCKLATPKTGLDFLDNW